MTTTSEQIYVMLFNVHNVPNLASKGETTQIVVICVTGCVAAPMSRICYFHRLTESNQSY